MNENIKESLDLALDTFDNLSLRGTKQSVSLWEEVFKYYYINHTDCFVPRNDNDYKLF